MLNGLSPEEHAVSAGGAESKSKVADSCWIAHLEQFQLASHARAWR